MLTESGKHWVEEGFEQSLQSMGNQKEKVLENLASCSEEEQLILKYYYSSMPYSDFTDTKFEVLKRYADHALWIWKNVPWCRDIPEKIFLMDVAAYRINNEKITDCRQFFFDMIWDRVKDRSMKEAILEVNYWCAENASYHLADFRTASPVAVYNSGLGRCGEESVFAVTALRSVGIPCRQVYTPRWAHCDDNHAWVEVWNDGEWFFLGACEPEEILNKGWFTHPASRAMLVHTKYFTCLPVKESEFSEGFIKYVNRTSLYTHTVRLSVKVVDAQGNPLQGVLVRFELLNEAVYVSIASKITDADGMVSIELGKGSVRITLRKDKKSQSVNAHAEDGLVTIVYTGEEDNTPWKEYRLDAPKGVVLHPGILTEEQKERNQRRMREADAMRTARIASYYKEEMGEKYPEVKELLCAAGRNVTEVMKFLDTDDNPYRSKLLQVLTLKDMYDLEADILEPSFQRGMSFLGTVPEEIFVPFLLNPRIEYEELTDYGQTILDFFTEEEKDLFRNKPRYVWKYIEDHIKDQELRDYNTLRISPAGALTLGLANEDSRKILFCAICRTLGVPAKINPVDGDVEFYQDGEFKSITIKVNEFIPSDVRLDFLFEDETQWKYFVDWTVAIYNAGRWETLNLERKKIQDGRMSVWTKPGDHRIMITTRTPQGDQLVREGKITVTSGEIRTISMVKREISQTDNLICKEIPDVILSTEDKTAIHTSDLTGSKRMILWLEEGKEPTEHVINELISQEALCRRFSDRILLLIHNWSVKQSATLEKLLVKVPELTCYVPADWEDSIKVCDALDLRHADFPFIYVTNETGEVIYADCGYNAGSVSLMFNLLEQ